MKQKSRKIKTAQAVTQTVTIALDELMARTDTNKTHLEITLRESSPH